MTVSSLYSAATGMEALQLQLDVTANNLANASTTAFKTSRVNFEDLYYQAIKTPGTLDSQGLRTAVGTQIGLGTRVQSTQFDFGQGTIQNTGRELDVAIVGDGFLQVQDGTQVLYTRAGALTVNADGLLVVASADRGRPIEPAITIPQDAETIAISESGIVSVQQAGTPGLTQVGEIQLARFLNPEGLLAKGDNLYAESAASGTPLPGTPGDLGFGVLRQGFLELSNTEPVRELIGLITTQRNFELNSQVIQAADQMLQLTANLRRF